MTTLTRLHEYCLGDQVEIFPARKLTRIDDTFENEAAASVESELRHARVAPEGMRLLEFAARQDIIILIERPQPRLAETLRKSGKIVMLDIVLDWIPELREERHRALSGVDHILVHTRQAEAALRTEFGNVCYLGAAHFWDVAEPRPVGTPKRFYFNIGAGGPLDRRCVALTLQLFHELLAREPSARLVMKMVPRAQKYLSGIPVEHPQIEIIDREIRTPEMLDLQKRMDVTLFPSRFEGLGFPMLESLFCGVPVITTDAAPMNEFVSDGANGLLVGCSPHGRFGMQTIQDLDPTSYREQIASLLGPGGSERLAALKARSTQGLVERQAAAKDGTRALMQSAFEVRTRDA